MFGMACHKVSFKISFLGQSKGSISDKTSAVHIYHNKEVVKLPFFIEVIYLPSL